MKKAFFVALALGAVSFSCSKRSTGSSGARYLFLDSHNLQPGGVTLDAVAKAHQADLAAQDAHGVNFIKYWVDEPAGKVYCLAEARDSASIYQTHKEAHGLVPARVRKVSDGKEAAAQGKGNLFLDVHRLGAGKVDAKALVEAHKHDLAAQGKHGVNFINYWFDERSGVVMCLAESPTPEALVETHKEAHGLVPDEIHKVNQGQ